MYGVVILPFYFSVVALNRRLAQVKVHQSYVQSAMFSIISRPSKMHSILVRSIAHAKMSNKSNLSLSLRKSAPKKKPKEKSLIIESIAPPGISNSANNCYANCVYQCLLNHESFLDVAGAMCAEHNRQICSHEGKCT